MNRIILLAIFVHGYACFLSAQPRFTYFLNGRPMDLAMNNALKTRGIGYAISFVYAGSDVFDKEVLKKCERQNKRTGRYMSRRSGFGVGWLDSLILLAQSEKQIHDSLHTLVSTHPDFISSCSGWLEPQMIITATYKQFKPIAYDIHLIGIRENDEMRKWRRIALFSFNGQHPIPERISCSEDLPLLFPENGIQ